MDETKGLTTRAGEIVRQKGTLLPGEITLSPEEVLTRDLTVDPPQGFEQITAMQQQLLHARIKDPKPSWHGLKVSLGMSNQVQHTPLIPYVRAVRIHELRKQDVEGGEGIDQRAQVLSRMRALSLTEPDPKAAALCARIFLDGIPPAPIEADKVAEMSAEELSEELRKLCMDIQGHDKATSEALSALTAMACELGPLPSQGNNPALSTLSDSLEAQEPPPGGPENEGGDPKKPL